MSELLTVDMAYDRNVHHLLSQDAIDVLEPLPSRVYIAFMNEETDKLWLVIQLSESALLHRRNFGKGSLMALKAALGKLGLSLGMRLSRELKLSLGLPLTGSETPEFSEPDCKQLPPRDALYTKIKSMGREAEGLKDLMWLDRNYPGIEVALRIYYTRS